MESEGLTINEAENQLAEEYDESAKSIASKVEAYKSFLDNYTNADIRFSSTEEEIDAYMEAHEDFDYINWFAAGSQYELLATLTNDDVSLLDLLTGDDYDIQTTERYLLYPLVSLLTEGQKASLSFVSLYYLISLGIGDDDTVKEGKETLDMSAVEGKENSIYEGIDRTIFSDGVALTNEALRLQASSGKPAVDSIWGSISTTSYILWGAFGLSTLFAIGLAVYNTYLNDLPKRLQKTILKIGEQADKAWEAGNQSFSEELVAQQDNVRKALRVAEQSEESAMVVFTYYAAAAMVAVSLVLFAVSIWNTYQDLKEYYNAEFTPIPLHMVDEGVDENDAKVYTYYDAVTCNREEQNMVTDANRLLDNYADLNGDVGRQWVALYTTKDKNAGNPLTELKVQYEDSNLPDETYTALSMFGEDAAQNLTNKTAGYTYSNGKNGIYLFYRTDANAFAGSVFSQNSEVLIGVTAAVVVGAAAFFVGMGVEKKRQKGKMANA